MLIISPTNPADQPSTTGTGLTVLVASRQIAKKYAIPEGEVKYEIAYALLAGHLYVRNQAGFPSCPLVLDLSVECIDLDDLNAYFASNGHDYRLYLAELENSNTGEAEAEAAHLSVTEVRIRKILSYLKDNGIDIMCIPRGWCAKTRKHFTEELKLFTPAGFDAAWKKGRGERFRVEGHHIYGRRY